MRCARVCGRASRVFVRARARVHMRDSAPRARQYARCGRSAAARLVVGVRVRRVSGGGGDDGSGGSGGGGRLPPGASAVSRVARARLGARRRARSVGERELRARVYSLARSLAHVAMAGRRASGSLDLRPSLARARSAYLRARVRDDHAAAAAAAVASAACCCGHRRQRQRRLEFLLSSFI